MITKNIKMHYCEFCGKKRMRSNAMAQHERHCTANINRQCRMCEGKTNYKAIIKNISRKHRDDLVVKRGEHGDYYSMDAQNIVQEIKEMCRDCPACTLTVIRHIGNPALYANYEYRNHSDEWFDRKQKEEAKRDEYDAMYGTR